jgi:molybdate transport system substrate-binding protein
MRGRWTIAAAIVSAVLGIGAGCGDDGSAGGDGDPPRLTVSAASSMTEALTECGKHFQGASVRLSFAGSDELAAQIRQGVKPDVFASANTELPAELAAEGRLSRPVEFVANTLVVAVPEDSEVDSVEDLLRPGTAVAMGSEAVPIGSYTREVLTRLPGDAGERILANVRSNEPDAKGIVGKLTQRAADAGFVYASDVEATDGALRALELPGELQPSVVYAAGVVEGAQQPALAERFIRGLVDGDCYDTLQRDGFGPLK